MGRAHSPAGRSWIETLLMFHLSPRRTASPTHPGKPQCRGGGPAASPAREGCRGRQPGGQQKLAATLPAPQLVWGTSAGKEEELCSPPFSQ